jgi:tight adherence protein C
VKAHWTAKIVLAALVPLLIAEVVRSVPVLVLAAVIGLLLPDLWRLHQRRVRRAKILQSLSFFLDLLVSLLQSGLAVEEAFRRAGEKGLPAGHPLAEEVRFTLNEIAAGDERSLAFAALATRTKIPDLHALASALSLGSKLGFPLADILATQAEIQRERRVERGRKRIDRAMVLALLPVLLCGFPIFLLVVVAPVVLEILKTLDLIRYLG